MDSLFWNVFCINAKNSIIVKIKFSEVNANLYKYIQA